MVAGRSTWGWYLCTYNCWEPLQTELLQYTDAASHAFVDIGANIGYYSLLVASTTAMPVLACEPIHANLQLLRDNVATNGVQLQVFIAPYAVGPCAAIKQFFTCAVNMGMCSGRLDGLSAEFGKTSLEWVQQHTLDTCFAAAACATATLHHEGGCGAAGA